MIIVLKPHPTPDVIQHVIERIEALGFTPHLSQGVSRTIVGVIGDEDKLQVEPLQAIEGVEQVVPILKPYKLASREFHAEDSVFDVKGVRVGGGHLLMIAGPCAIEGEAVLMEIAETVRDAGANVLRGGAFKPRTSPYSFQGLGEDGLKMLKAAGERFGMPVVTEVMDPRQVELVERYADMIQVGARNMQNFDLLKEVGRTRSPVLLKRGMSATVKDLLMSAEYVLAQGNRRVVLCERGVRTFEDSTRNTLDLSIVPNVQGLSHLPIIVDPSHATGRPDLIPAMARAAVAAGADGVHIEVHSCPEKALSDGPQALLPKQYAALMEELAAARRDPGPDDRRRRGSDRLMAIRPLFIAGNWKMNPSTADRGGRAGRGGQGGRRPGGRRPRGRLPPVGVPAPGRRRARQLADRPGRPEHALAARRGVHRRGLGRDAPGRRLHARDPRPQREEARAGRDRRAGQRQAPRRARRRPDPDRLHRRDPPGARGGPDRGRRRRPAHRVSGRAVGRADGGRGPGLRAGLGDRHRADGHPSAGAGGPRVHPRLA